MRCIRPLKAYHHRDETIKKLTYSYKESNKELVAYDFDCRKCLACRLNQAREKAIRAQHEASMHEHNTFLTLTYSEEHLESPKLIYKHFQTFMDSLRNRTALKIPYMVTGEYGDKNKRPHWHALLFNYWPKDAKFERTTDLGHNTFTSQEIEDLWHKGKHDIGSLTLDSANYVARYAAKKLTHGKDQNHDFHPIHKTSSKYGIGRTWIEKYWKQTFRLGYIILPNGSKSAIPRYYSDWLEKHKPEEYIHYVTQVRPKIQTLAFEQEQKEVQNYLNDFHSKNASPQGRKNVKETILKLKFKQLQENLKL